VPEGFAEVYVKLEYYNPTGSYKDRMALAMIEGAEKPGEQNPDMTVVEYTGGSTGSSIAMVCAVKGYRFQALSSDAFAREKLETMRAFGADLRLLPGDGGKITSDLFDRFKTEIQTLAAQPGTFYTDQMNNRDSMVGYRGIGRELFKQLNGRITVSCAAVGMAGMLMGVSSVLKDAGCAARIIALDPASSPVVTNGTPGPHRVEGIGVGFWPPHLDRSLFDEARTIDESEARVRARRLAREEGILAGTSSALNVTAAVRIAREPSPGATVVTVACDSGLKYRSGDLFPNG
jgi:cysteine synthase A